VSKWTPRSHKYRLLCIKVKREEPNCWICGKPIDPKLGRPDPQCYSTDHVIAASIAPHLAEVRSNLRAAHLVCNQRRQTGQTKAAVTSPLALSVDDF
jgi:5-methylcytosine-specific restriction endonuclease McrA